MPQFVTIEGSIRPCQELPRGHRKTVVLTDRVRSLIQRGFFDLIELHSAQAVDDDLDDSDEEDAPSTEDGDTLPEPLAEPKVTQSTDDWKAFFDAQGIAYPEDVKRAGLINAWHAIKQQRSQG